MNILSIENIQKIWVLLGAVLTTVGFSWMPDIIMNLFGPEGTDLVFRVFTAAAALYQFVTRRTGGNPIEPEAYSTGEKSKIMYLINPFAKAA